MSGVHVELEHYDLSLENRRRTQNEVVLAAARAMKEAGLRHQGRHDHARGRGRRRQPQQDPARGGRRQGHHPVRAAASRASRRWAACIIPMSVVRMAVEDAYGAEERREAAERRRGRVPHRAGAPLGVPGGCGVRVPHRRAHARARLRRAEVDGQPRVRGDAEGGAGLRGRAVRRRSLPAAADRRDVRRAGRRRAVGGAARDPRAQPRRRLPFGDGPGAVRVDRGSGVGAALVRRGPAHDRRDDRGAARHRSRAAGQGHREPDGDDPRGGRAAALPRRGRPRRRPRPPRARCTRRCWRPPRRASARRTSAATPRRRS